MTRLDITIYIDVRGDQTGPHNILMQNRPDWTPQYILMQNKTQLNRSQLEKKGGSLEHGLSAQFVSATGDQRVHQSTEIMSTFIFHAKSCPLL